jgi:hypothetical protein
MSTKTVLKGSERWCNHQDGTVDLLRIDLLRITVLCQTGLAQNGLTQKGVAPIGFAQNVFTQNSFVRKPDLLRKYLGQNEICSIDMRVIFYNEVDQNNF